MNIVVIGSGYVGLVSGTCFSEMGNKVTCVDEEEAVQLAIMIKGLINTIANNLKELSPFTFKLCPGT